jgi:hypothetical protein
MRDFLRRLVKASQWGASLVLVAACGSQVEGGPADQSGNLLEPTPNGACYGPIYNDGFGYHGQCCDDVYCTAPIDGVCASPADAALTGLPPGSGSCECGERKGPFANADPNAVESCCYLVGSIGCDGRPLMINGAPRLAEVVPGPSQWSAPSDEAPLDMQNVESMDADLRARLSERWMERARFEHASIASFARFSLALLACGAPPELVAASHRAAMDEVRHAQLALSMASHYAGKPLGFGALDISGTLDGPMSLEAITLATVIEGCVGETLAAIEVAASAAEARSESIRRALAGIAEDETLHAELAWAFVRWAIGNGGSTLRNRVASTFEQAFEKVIADASLNDDSGAAEHGFLSGREIKALRRQAIADVLRPAVETLLGARLAGNYATPVRTVSP